MKYFKKIKSYLYVLSVYVFLGLPIAYMRFPDIRNELKYLVITNSMKEDKNFFILKYLSELYPDKPPLYFWILALCKSSFFLSIVLGSLVPSFIITVFLYKMLKNFLPEKRALLISLFSCTLPCFMGLSVFLRMDMLMSCFIFLALYLFFGFYYNFVERNFFNIILFYLFIFLGVFTKGVSGIMIPLAVITAFLILERDMGFFKKLHMGKGMILIIFLLSLWLLKISTFPEGKEYISLLLGQETVGRIVKAKTHTRSFYYYFQQLPLIFYPYGILVIAALISYIQDIKLWNGWNELEKIGFVYILFPFMIFSLASGKLAIYLLPLFPGAIILINCFLERSESKVKGYIFNLTMILGVFPWIIKKLFNLKDRIIVFIISNICTLVVILLGLNFYNNNYTLKPFIDILPPEVKTYKFDDGANLKYYTEYRVKAYDIGNIERKESGYFITRNKYRKDLERLNCRMIFENREYSLYEKLKNNDK